MKQKEKERVKKKKIIKILAVIKSDTFTKEKLT